MIAQGAHASMKVIFDMMELVAGTGGKYYYKRLPIQPNTPLEEWVNKIFKKVVVGGTLSEITAAYQKARVVDIPCALIEDKGLTEFGGEVTITACAIGPASPEDIDPITKHLKLL
jgi:PTH2 family peptidyl-tRNA hydrolase